MKRFDCILALGTLVLLSLSLLAAEPMRAQESSTLPVMRVGEVCGKVWILKSGSMDWVEAAGHSGSALAQGDLIATRESSYIEIELGSRTLLRLGDHTEARILDVASEGSEVQLQVGVASISALAKKSDPRLRIITPAASVRPLGQGHYRVDVDLNDGTRVTVRKGKAEVTAPRGRVILGKHQLVRVQNDGEPKYLATRAPRRDAWDNFVQGLDHDLEHPPSSDSASDSEESQSDSWVGLVLDIVNALRSNDNDNDDD